MKRTYVWATLLLSFGLCNLSMTSCSDNEEKKQPEETAQDTKNDNNQDTGLSVNGHKAIDLGLSVKWATCNVDAKFPEAFGSYYAWGETEEKSDNNWSTYKYGDGAESTMTKYCTNNAHGTVDNKTVLDAEDDVARVKWGGSWRMPTEQEINELLNDCTWKWTIQNSVKGYVVTSKSNGNSIFLPTAGFRWSEEATLNGSDGGYWTASLDGNNSNCAHYLHFNSDYRGVNNDGYRFTGFSVRPVTE